MARSLAGEGVRTVDRINVTPIIDVALVLVIVLLVTAPMLAVTDSSIELPPATGRTGAGDDRIFITLGGDGRLGIDDQFVTRGELGPELRTRLEKHRGAIVIVRADLTVPHAAVRGLLEDAKAAGATRLAVATRPEDAP